MIQRWNMFLVVVFGVFSCLMLITGCEHRPGAIPSVIESLSLPRETQQILLVMVPSWDDSGGTLRMCLRAGNVWEIRGDPISVVVGRHGLGWGCGLHVSESSGPQKVEGDGRSPAGIFSLGPAFGYSGHSIEGSIYPYRQATAFDYFIDDSESPQYNQWVSLLDSTRQDPRFYWNSFEHMRRDDRLYELGIIVKHNMDPVQKGRGSAIFLHIWGGPDHPTAGCTAMSRENLIEVLRWLDPAQNPLLVQLPEVVLMNGFPGD